MDAGVTAEERGEGAVEEVTGGHFPEAKKDTGHWRKDPLRPGTGKEIQMANKRKKQYQAIHSSKEIHMQTPVFSSI